MLFAVFYLLLRRLVGLAGGSAEDRHSDIEVLVLRHQLAVLRRRVWPAAPSPPRSAIHGCAKQGAPAPALVIVPGQSPDSSSVAP